MTNGRLADNEKVKGNTMKSKASKIGLIVGLILVLFGGIGNIFGQTNNGSSTRESSDTANRADQNLKSVARINPSTLAMEFSLPLMSYLGRNGNSLPVGFNYSSKIWRMDSGLTWWYWQNTQPKYVTDIHARYGERSAAGWTSNLLPPRLDDSSPQLYKEDGQPWEINIFDQAGLNNNWQNILNGFAQNLSLPCGSRCSRWEWNCPNNDHSCPMSEATIICTTYEIAYCDTGGGGGGPVFPEPPPPVNLYYVKRLQVAMADGSTHEFRASDTPVSCGTNQAVCEPDMTGTYLAVDGSGMKLVKTSSGSTLFMPDSSRYTFLAGNNADGTFAKDYIDADGNTLSFSRTTANNLTTNKWTDTMGREIVDPMPYNWITQTQRRGTQEVDLPGFDGGTQDYKLKWSHLKPIQCETSTDENCGAVNGVVDGALENQAQKLYYETKYECRGNVSTDLNAQSNGEVLFPEQESGVRPCNGFNILRDSSGEPILDGNGMAQPISTRFNPTVLTEVELPNGKKYEFKYNRYGEITKIIYPTGSYETFVYDKITPMNGAGKPAYDQTNRGVVERKVYRKISANDHVLEQTWKYSATLDYGTGSYKITTKSSTGENASAEVLRNERFLHPSNVDNNLFGFNEPLAGFPKEELSYDENQVLRSRTLTEYTTKSVSITSPQTMSVLRDVRVKRTVSMAIENGLALASLSETEYNEPTTTGNNAQTDPEYFSHLNVKRTKGYHYAVIDVTTAQTGSLATIATYFNNNLLAGVAETDYLYDANYKARGIASLVTETRVLNPTNNDVIAKTQTVYDESSRLVGDSGSLSGNLTTTWVNPATDQSLPSGSETRRGKPTTVKLWDNDNNNWIETHTQYDQYGNVRKAWEASTATSYDPTRFVETQYSSDYAFAYPTKVITPAPDPNNSTGTNQTSTAETTYDFMTGLPLSVKDDFGQVIKTEYNDALLRPTRTFAYNFTAPESQTIYDDNNLTVKVRKQIDANGNWDEATTFLDSLGRTFKTQAKDSQGDVFVETKYDLLGRVKWTSNPYRSGEGEKFWSRPRYDELGRVFESCAPVAESSVNFDSTGACPTGTSSGVTEYGFSTQTGFVGTVVTATDASGRKSRSFTNALGQLIRVDEPSSTNTLEAIPQSTPTPNPSPSPTPTGGGGPTGCVIGTQNCLTNADYPMNSTYYVYNPQGKMVKVIQGDQNRYFKYDSLGRLIRVKQPEQDPNDSLDMTDFYNTSGKWSAGFKYNELGDLIKATDANGVNIINEYDQAKRVTKRCYTKPNFTTTATNCGSISANDLSANTPTVEYFYDGFLALNQPPTASPNVAKGKLTRVTSSISDTRYTQFDNLGRLLQMSQITDGQTYTSSYEYNFAGALVKETYPSGRVVRSEFKPDGDLSRIYGKVNPNATERTYANGFSYTPDGKIQRLKLGNNRWESAKFNERLQVTELALGTSDGDGSLWKLQYEYGELQSNGTVDTNKNTGNIAKQTVSFNGLTNPFVQTYKYDSLYRLTEAKEVAGTTQNWKENYGYDRYGNRLDYHKFVGTTELELDNKAHPTIDSNTNRFTDTVIFNYDKNGNLTKDGESRNFVFNGENKQTEIKDSNGATIGQYFYDGEGKRIKKVTNTEITVFVYSAGKLVAEYSTATPPTNPTTKWTATDQLGSPRVITDANGQVISRRDFMPFGEEVANSIGNRSTAEKYGTTDGIRQKFTGYQKDEETGLDFAEARMYENRHGRFTAVDPLLASGKSANPQTFNRYVYCLNNPLVYTDPDGLQAGFWGYRDKGDSLSFHYFKSQEDFDNHNKIVDTEFGKANGLQRYQVWTRGEYVLSGDRTQNLKLNNDGSSYRFSTEGFGTDEQWDKIYGEWAGGKNLEEIGENGWGLAVVQAADRMREPSGLLFQPGAQRFLNETQRISDATVPLIPQMIAYSAASRSATSMVNARRSAVLAQIAEGEASMQGLSGRQKLAVGVDLRSGAILTAKSGGLYTEPISFRMRLTSTYLNLKGGSLEGWCSTNCAEFRLLNNAMNQGLRSRDFVYTVVGRNSAKFGGGFFTAGRCFNCQVTTPIFGTGYNGNKPRSF